MRKETTYNWLALFLALYTETRKSLLILAGMLVNEGLTLDLWVTLFLGVLRGSHTLASYYGRQQSGGDPAHTDEDRAYGEAVTLGESLYLKKFADAIRDGNYTENEGILDLTAIEKRSAYYADRLVGTAGQAFVAASPAGATFTWVLDDRAHHCYPRPGFDVTCPEMADRNPHTKETLVTLPLENGTPCLFNCRCRLVRDDGVECFQLGLEETNR